MSNNSRGTKQQSTPAVMAWVFAFLWPAGIGYAQELDFYKDVFPALESNCVSCHNKTSSKSGLNLETPDTIRKGGDSGPALVPGNGAESLIVKSAAHKTDAAMPPKNNKSGAVDLSAAELERLSKWIDQGAKASVKESRQVAWHPLPAGVSPIYAVALTGDGKLSACARGGRVFLYDLQTRNFVGQLVDPKLSENGGVNGTGAAAHFSAVHSLSFSADGSRIATGGFREAKIWKRQPSPAKLQPLALTPEQRGTQVQLTPDGKWLVNFSKEGSLQVLDAGSGTLVRNISIDSSLRSFLRISSDSTHALVASETAAGGVWSLVTGERLGLAQPIPPLTAANWSHDSTQLYLVKDGKTVHIIDAAEPAQNSDASTAATAVLQKVASIETNSPVTKVERGPTADTLLIHAGDKVLLWSVGQAKLLHEFKAGTATCMSASPDGKLVTIGSKDGALRIFETQTAKQLHEFRGTAKTAANLAALEWDSNRAGLDIAFQKGVLARLETESKDLENHFKKTTDAIAAAKKALPDKAKAATAASEATTAARKSSEESEAAITAAPDGKPSAAMAARRKETATKLDAAIASEKSAAAALIAVENGIRDGEENLQRIAAGRSKNSAALAAANAATESAKAAQNAAQAKVAEVKKLEANPEAACVSVRLSADGTLAAAALSSGWVQTWSLATGGALEGFEIGHPIATAELLFTSSGCFELLTAENERVSTSHPDSWILERTIGKTSGEESISERVSAVRFSPDGKMLATGSGEFSRSGDVHLWEVGSGKLSAVWRDKHRDSVLALDFSSNGKWIGSGSADRLAKVTEIATGRQVYALEAHTHHVLSVSFRADDKALATSGGDGVVNVWDMESGERKKKIVGWSKEVTALQYMGATSQIVASSGDNQVRIVSDDGTEVRAMTKLPDFMQSAASAHTANVIVAGGEDSALRVWDSATGKELATFSNR